MQLGDTIAAISTPPGKGGIGIIRLSGPEAIAIADIFFRGKSKSPLSAVKSHTVHYGYFTDPDNGETIDEVLCLVMHAPHSYTCEDMVEINAHGGSYILQYLLSLVIRKGARMAEKGEFTYRAYINGRIDLSQAEGVADLINAETEKSMKNAVRQVSGALKEKIRTIRNSVLEVYADFEAEIDFIEDNIEILDKNEGIGRLEGVKTQLTKLIESYQSGKYLKNGVRVGLFGWVNVGKSSLFNALLDADRVIVSEEPGTTRDVVEADMHFRGIRFHLVDTAGLRLQPGAIEAEGVRRTEQTMKESDAALFIMDCSSLKPAEDGEIYTRLKERFPDERQLLVIFNKIDLMEKGWKPPEHWKSFDFHCTSAKEKRGIEAIKSRLYENLIENGGTDRESIYIVNTRHCALLQQARDDIEKAVQGLRNKLSVEFIALDLQQCLSKLGEVTGETVSDELLDNIFSRFCIGK